MTGIQKRSFIHSACSKPILHLHYDATNATLAKYIWDHHRDRLDCFAIANEPDLQRVFKQDFEVRDFATYLAKWRRFAAAITNAVPEAKSAGADAGESPMAAGRSILLKNFGKRCRLPVHGDRTLLSRRCGPECVPRKKGIDDMLVVEMERQLRRGSTGRPKCLCCKLLGLPYRFTEANDHYSGGAKDASDTFAGALWALDFLHWWMAHTALSGVDFHNTQWVVK